MRPAPRPRRGSGPGRDEAWRDRAARAACPDPQPRLDAVLLATLLTILLYAALA